MFPYVRLPVGVIRDRAKFVGQDLEPRRRKPQQKREENVRTHLTVNLVHPDRLVAIDDRRHRLVIHAKRILYLQRKRVRSHERHHQ